MEEQLSKARIYFPYCKTECSMLFNSVCIKERLLPNYSNIRSLFIVNVRSNQQDGLCGDVLLFNFLRLEILHCISDERRN